MCKILLKITKNNKSINREIICPYSDKDKIKEWLREFYPVTCSFYRIEEI
jgi:hypothetical protein